MENEHTLDWLIALVENAKSIDNEEVKKKAVASVPTSLVESLMHNSASTEPSTELKLFGKGIPASPGAASGVVFF